MQKYYSQRYRYFSKFDQGCIIKHDENWFSVTPEKIAQHIAEKCSCDTIVDAFCGIGGNAIQFAMTCRRVIAIDINKDYLEQAWQNACVYGVQDRIEFVHGDFFEILQHWQKCDMKVDGIFLSPPWGGIDYIKQSLYSLDSLQPMAGQQLIQKCRSLTDNLILYLPRNTDLHELMQLRHCDPMEIEQNYLDGRLKTLIVYFGVFANNLID